MDQCALIRPLVCYCASDGVSREAPASHSEDLLEFSYIPVFCISSSQSLHKTLHKALSFPDLFILNAILEI